MASTDDNLAPIAIIGLALRLPGKVSTPEEFWSLLINKQDGRCRVPEDRYNIDAFHDDNEKGQMRVASDHGYFLDHVNLKAFDASFFSSKRNEAEVTDPQQRLLLEVAWECMESAGQTSLQGSDTGVYVGVFGEDWHNMQHRDEQTFSAYRVLSAGDYALANRLSYEFDFRGPSMTIRTACSASLSGLHLACQALRNGDCETALVAGSSLIMDPSMTLDMSQQGVLSPSGSCKTFDAAADGFARGEAINAILIKPLDKAIRDGDPVRAVIRSTAVNSDGKTSHLGSPSTQSQVEMIRKAYQAAGISDFAQTPFFECHGTGTSVGDPLEAAAVGAVFGGNHTYIGSVKPNVGHGEGASGITSIIKAVLALENNMIPPNIKFSTPNPNIPFKKYNFEVPTEAVLWPEGRHPRISVNSFGIGGANAHVIIDSAASFGLPKSTSNVSPEKSWPRVLPVSANSAKSLQARIQDLKAYMEHHPGHLDDLAFTMGRRRAHLPHRSFCVIRDGINGPLEFHTAMKSSISQTSTEAKRPVYIFTGQGAQWNGMARSLVHESPSFCEDIREMDETLQTLPNPPSWRMEAILRVEDESNILVNTAEVSQPLCTAIQIALVNHLATFGINPGAVVGHSSGEIAAAYAAGALPMSAAIICAYLRGQAMGGVADAGGMAAIGLGSEAVQRYLSPAVQLACENGPASVTISGDREAVEETIRAIKQEDPEIFARMLHVNVAYHSEHMRTVGVAYEELLSSQLICAQGTLHTPMYSTVTGQQVTQELEFGSAYWRENLESSVLFYSAVKELLQGMPEVHTILEIGPHSALQGPLRQIVQEQQAQQPPTYVPSLVRDQDALLSIRNTLGQLWITGHDVDFSSINPHGSVLTDLPNYPWDHDQEFWKETNLSKAWRHRVHVHHELLGSLCPESNDLQMSWRNVLHESDVTWLRDHRVGSNVVFPCAGYIAMMGEAIRQVTGSESYSLRNLMVKSAFMLPQIEATEVVTTMKPIRVTELTSSGDWYEISVSTFNGQMWTEKCVAQARASDELVPASKEIHMQVRHISPEYFYERMAHVGLRYGPNFQSLREISAATKSYVANASISAKNGESSTRYSAHPATIDACLQLCAVAGCKGLARQMDTLVLPVDIRDVYISPVLTSLRAKATLDPTSAVGQAIAVEKDETDEKIQKGSGKINISLSGIRGIPFDTGNLSRSHETQDLARLEWLPHIDYYPPEDLIRPRAGKRDMRLQLEQIALLCVLQTLDLVKDLDCTPSGHLAKYVAWMERERERMIRGPHSDMFPDGRTWALMALEDRKPLINSLMEAVKSAGEATVTNAVSLLYDAAQPENLAPVFSGQMNPLQTLLDDGRLADFYRLETSLVDTSDFFRLCGHARPNMRVIEIGAGTGSTTEAALAELETRDGTRMYSEYVFTDISPGFFEAARDRFKDKRCVEYKLLDIEKDPVEQGFEAGSYDLVIANNVLHATRSLQSTLKNVRKLLCDEGRLYLGEIVEPYKGIGVPFLMGRLEGWWLGEDDGRRDAPFVSVERWDRELKEAGFSGADTSVLDDEPPYHACAHMTSRAVPNDLSYIKPEIIVMLYKSEKVDFGQKLAASLEDKGFLVYWKRVGDDDDALSRNDIKHAVSLVDLEGPFFENISPDEYQRFIKHLGSYNGGTLWLTPTTQFGCANPAYGIANGVARTVRVEMSVDFWTVELQRIDTDALSACLTLCERFCDRKQRSHGQDNEFMVHDGIIHVGRYHWTSLPKAVKPEPSNEGFKQMVIGQYGLLDSVKWVEREAVSLQPHEVEVDIRCVGLNFRDIMVAIGIVPKPKDSLGYEASGVVTRAGSSISHVTEGDRVFVAHNGLFATRKAVPGQCVAKIPEALSFEEAVTMPIVYLTAIYAIVTLGQMQKGQSILIHSGTGGVGQAAINICQTLGVEVYVTVGNDEKAKYLVEHHGIPRERIFDSHSISFHEGVIQATDGRGVDVVLNSLSGELLHASWKCVAKCGKMMEIGKRDILEHGRLALDMFQHNRTFYGIDMETLVDERPELYQTLIDQLIQLSTNKTAKPIQPIHQFPAGKISDALRFMKAGTHIGKIVVSMPEDTSEIKASGVPSPSLLSSTGTYLIVGGFGGLGKSVVRWMLERGARNFLFLGRSTGVPENHYFLDELRCQGCNVLAWAGSVAEMRDVQWAIDAAPSPIVGVLQMAMVIRDRPVLQMSYEDWKIVQDCKVKGTWNLHHALAGADLDFFILMSSISACVGHPGQTNYSSANSFLDSFAQYRHGLGLPCSVINLGGMDGIGFLSQRPAKLNLYRAHGLHLLHEQHLVDAVELAIARSAPPADATNLGALQPLVNPNQIVVGLNTSRPLSDPKNRALYKGELRVCLYNNIAPVVTDESDDSNAGRDDGLRALLSQAEADPSILEDPETLRRVSWEIGRTLFSFLLLPEENLDISLTLTAIGIDSLVSIEIRNWWRKILGLEITVLEITNAGTIEGLGKLAVASLKEKYHVQGEVEEEDRG